MIPFSATPSLSSSGIIGMDVSERQSSSLMPWLLPTRVQTTAVEPQLLAHIALNSAEEPAKESTYSNKLRPAFLASSSSSIFLGIRNGQGFIRRNRHRHPSLELNELQVRENDV
jgi:hypothetical protein